MVKLLRNKWKSDTKKSALGRKKKKEDKFMKSQI